MSGRSVTALTVLLVHGAFADTSLWSLVIAQLGVAGVAAGPATNPLRGLAADAGYLAGIARNIAGPVLLVGHAYGGAVITAAASRVDNAIGLVYVAGYALDSGENVADVTRRFPETQLPGALRRRPDLPGPERQARADIEPSAFPAVFAADVPAPLAEMLAAAQRPVALDCLTDRMRNPAWRILPTWYLVAADDQCVHPQAQRFMARRAAARTAETAGSHAVAVSQPTAVADVVLTAAHALN
jgi:pimeloyl-ACP methyl ester carboxylesterase